MERQQLRRWEMKRKDSFPRISDKIMVHSSQMDSGSVCIVTQQKRGEYRKLIVSLAVIVLTYLFTGFVAPNM